MTAQLNGKWRNNPVVSLDRDMQSRRPPRKTLAQRHQRRRVDRRWPALLRTDREGVRQAADKWSVRILHLLGGQQNPLGQPPPIEGAVAPRQTQQRVGVDEPAPLHR